MSAPKLFFAVVLLSLSFSASQGQVEPFTVKSVAQWPGYTRGLYNAFCVRSNLVYAAMSDGLTVIDFRKPSRPSILGGCFGGQNAWEIVVQGSYAFVACGKEGLLIYDISNPSAPSLSGKLETLGAAMDLELFGDIVCIADDAAGLLTVDVSDKKMPKILGRAPALGESHSVALFDHYACVAEHDAGLQIVDLSDPGLPKKVGELNLPGYASDVRMSGRCAVLTVDKSGFLLVDVSDPFRPRQLAPLYACQYPEVAAVSGETVFTHDAAESFTLRWDLRNPEKPVNDGKFPVEDFKGLFVSGKSAYLMDQTNIKLIDVQKAGRERVIGQISGFGFTQAVCPNGAWLYAATREVGLEILDVSKPSKPKLTKTLTVMTNASALALNGSMLYVTANDHLWVLDVTKPDKPEVISRCSLGTADDFGDAVMVDEPQQIIIYDKYALITFWFELDKTTVCNVADPKKPTLMRELESDPFEDLPQSSDLEKCVAIGENFIDLRKEGDPILAGRLQDIEIPGPPFRSGNYLFVPDLFETLVVWDLTNPEQRRFKYTFTDGTSPRRVIVKDQHAFLTHDRRSIHLFDVSVPEKPVWLEEVKAAGRGIDLIAAVDLVYLANGDAGVEIFQVCRGTEGEAVRQKRLAAPPIAPSTNKIFRKLVVEQANAEAKPTLTLEEQEVIEALLADHFKDSTNQIVLMGETANRGASALPGELKEDAEKEAEQDFIQKNQEPVNVVWPKESPKNVVMIPKKTLNSLFSGKHSHGEYGWEAFYEQFPHGLGITEISRPGIDSKGTAAIIYMGTQSHYTAGSGRFYLLRKKGGKWVYKKTIGSGWVS